MQCIVPKNDFDLFYSGESFSCEQPLSITCPLCGSLGFTESTLLEHVTNEHANSDNDESSAGVVCPICGVDTNQLTYDFATHLTMEHRTPRDPIEQVAIRGRGGRCHTRTSGPRGRRAQTHFNAVGGPTGSSPSSRDSTDPLVEILAQLSGVRRAGGASSNQSPASQLHQLQMHLQSSPSFPRTSNDREVRVMRRTYQSMNNQTNSSSSTSTSTAIPGSAGASAYTAANTHYCGSQPFILMDQSPLGTGVVSSPTTGASGLATVTTAGSSGPPTNSALPNQLALDGSSLSSQYLLARCMKPTLTEAEQQQREILKADRSLFVQELLLQVGLLEKNK